MKILVHKNIKNYETQRALMMLIRMMKMTEMMLLLLMTIIKVYVVIKFPILLNMFQNSAILKKQSERVNLKIIKYRLR